MKVLVTGDAGFTGSYIVDRFVRAGLQIYVLDNLRTNAGGIDDETEF